MMNVAHASSSSDFVRSFLSRDDFGSDDDGDSKPMMDCYAILHLGTSSTNISAVLHLIIPPADDSSLIENSIHLSDKQSIMIHPMLLRVLLKSQQMMTKEHGDAPETLAYDSRHSVHVTSYYEGTDSDDLDVGEGWLEKVSIEDIHNVDPNSSNVTETISVKLQYMCSSSEKYRRYFKDSTNESSAIQLLKEKLADAVVTEGTILGIDHKCQNQVGSANTREASFFMVDKVESSTRKSLRHVRLSSMNFNITLTSPTTKADNGPPAQDNAPSQYSCPGYNSVLDELLHLAAFRNSDGRPTAVILSGCAGVGKTRMASWLEDELTKTTQMVSAKVSAKDILLEEASSTFDASQVIDQLSQSHNKSVLLVIDDLDFVIGESDDADSKHESEQFRAMNAIAKLIDQTTDKFASTCFILGLCHSSWAELPIQLARVGRFEKLITMPSPTQIQRKEIFKFWLSTMPSSNNTSIDNSQLIMDEWAELLTPRTAGCVAADIRRICADALTSAMARAQQTSEGSKGAKVNWDDIKEATRRCIPSQLSSLDVIPTNLRDYDGNEKLTLQPKEEFELAWKKFGGYQNEKKRLYRAIARPWKFYMDHAETNPCSESASSLSATLGFSKPSGVLFHGPSGCGKSFAALCLASSMGLHCVKVKASEVFNQWLGGSEANLRSIFSRARAASPCILFFDELDALAMNRESHDSDAMSGVQSRILTTLLNEMDGITNAGGKQDILVVAATNRLDAIDAALLRPGRLEEHVLLSYPTPESINEILLLQTSKMPLDDSVLVEELSHTLAAATCSCAEVEGICRDACLIAMRRSSTEGSSNDYLSVTRSDFDEALNRIKQRVTTKADLTYSKKKF